jgi:hypothetical protein
MNGYTDGRAPPRESVAEKSSEIQGTEMVGPGCSVISQKPTLRAASPIQVVHLLTQNERDIGRNLMSRDGAKK